jgi:hypothetical protein
LMETIIALGIGLETSFIGQFIRDNKLLYPVANVVHLLAVLVFFASVAAMDLRVIGIIQGGPIDQVIAKLRPIAMFALGVLVLSGFVLFAPEAAAMVKNISFQLKFGAIGFGMLNVLLFKGMTRRRFGAEPMMSASFPVRLSASLSLVTWLTVAAAGRFVAYA